MCECEIAAQVCVLTQEGRRGVLCDDKIEALFVSASVGFESPVDSLHWQS